MAGASVMGKGVRIAWLRNTLRCNILTDVHLDSSSCGFFCGPKEFGGGCFIHILLPQFAHTRAGTLLMISVIPSLSKVTVALPGLVSPCLQITHFMTLSSS